MRPARVAFSGLLLSAFLLLSGVGMKNHLQQEAERFHQSDFDGAIAEFSGMASSGIRNGILYYNLGTAYLMRADVGNAILWYERALPLLPGDPDLRANLATARSMRRDAPLSEPAYADFLFFWRRWISLPGLQWLSIAFSSAGWGLLGFGFFRKTKFSRLFSASLILISLLMAGSVYSVQREVSGSFYGIVIPEEIPVRSGLSPGARKLFSLHAGTKVRILEKREGFCKIARSRGSIGWVDQSDVAAL